MDKAEIEKILEELAGKTTNQMNEITQLRQLNPQVAIEEIKKAIAQSSSSLTTLIIKWLEEKRQDTKSVLDRDYPRGFNEKVIGRNQLITELIGELR
jgi:cell division inhibitor SulA